MYTLLVILIVIAAILMIGVVLIQESKGGGLSSNFSSSNAIMGVRKTTDFVEKLTWGCAIFMVVLSVISTRIAPQATTDQSVIEKATKDDGATNPNNLPNFGASQQKQAAPAAQGQPTKAPAAPATSAAPQTTAAAAPGDNVFSGREASSLRGTTEKMSRLRQTIARRMVESLATAAQLTTVIEVDVTKIAALRARAKDAFVQRENTKLTFLPFFVKAATEALRFHPKVNATINDKEVTYFDHENIGIAVDTERGLLVPVIKNAQGMSIADVSRSINDLAARTRSATIGADELSGSTFTITNTGSGGALFDTPVLNMPETAIMGVGTIVKRPVVMKGADGADVIAIRSMVYLSLSYDHRLVDGADASRFLMDVKKRLEEGAFEADLGL